MKGVENFIRGAQKEIEELKLDMTYCRNDVTIKVLERAIENKIYLISELKVKYGIK